jgi:hypothetical protein
MSSASLPLDQYTDRDLIEARDAVRLCPKRNFSRAGEGLIGAREQRFAVELNGEPLALRFEPERVPLISGDFGIDPVNLLPTALNDAVKANIVFERVCAHDVIVVGIEDTDGNATGLINAPATGLNLTETATFFAATDSKMASGKR